MTRPLVPPPIAPFALERYFARWEFVAPFLASSSDVEGYLLRDLLALADEETRALWNDLGLGYGESPGHPLLRREIAALYTNVTPEDIVACVSAEEAIYLCTRVIVRPGDHIVASFPAYQSSYEVARSIGAEVSLWQGKPAAKDGVATWTFDLEELRALLRPNTRLITVNFPNNPTGATLSERDLRAIAALAEEKGIYLMSDEVYRFMEYREEDRLPGATDLYERAISIGAMSKSFALAGLRVGWIATRDKDLVREALAYKDYTTICGSVPSELLAIMALRAKADVLARTQGILEENLTLARTFMREHERYFEWFAPQAASVAFPRLRANVPVAAFAEELVQAEGVMLLASNVFGYDGNHFRLGLGRKNLAPALQRLGRFARAKLG